jgi:DNA invertase Pin-like site-specific DNA recombinase
MEQATMKRAVLYLRVSTADQTTANQERELREVATRAGWDFVKVYRDHGFSGSKGRDKRPAFDSLYRAAARREFDVVMAWSVDRLGRSLKDLVNFLEELRVLNVDLFLKTQGIDTTSPSRQGYVRHAVGLCRFRAIDHPRAGARRPSTSQGRGKSAWAAQDRRRH